MGKQLDRDVLIDHLRRMMEARQIDRLPRSGYAKAIEDVAGCPTAKPMTVHVTAEINYRKIGNCPNCGKPINSGDYPNCCGRCGQAVKWDG